MNLRGYSGKPLKGLNLNYALSDLHSYLSFLNYSLFTKHKTHTPHLFLVNILDLTLWVAYL